MACLVERFEGEGLAVNELEYNITKHSHQKIALLKAVEHNFW